MEQFRVVSQWSVCPAVQGLDGTVQSCQWSVCPAVHGLDGTVQSCQSVVRLSCCTGVRWNSSELSVVRLSCCTWVRWNSSELSVSDPSVLLYRHDNELFNGPSVLLYRGLRALFRCFSGLSLPLAVCLSLYSRPYSIESVCAFLIVSARQFLGIFSFLISLPPTYL